MTATFMLQLVIGASMAMGGNVLQDAFGVVAMVAMMPLISIQAVEALSIGLEKKKVSATAGGSLRRLRYSRTLGGGYDMNYVISICSPESMSTLTGICRELSFLLSVVLLGEGTASRGMLDILGIENNEKEFW